MATTRRMPWWAERTTGDLLILGISFTVCFSVLASGALVGLLALLQPQRDTSIMVGAISDVINTLIGLLAGFLAGRTDARMTMTRAADGTRTWEAEGIRPTTAKDRQGSGDASDV